MKLEKEARKLRKEVEIDEKNPQFLNENKIMLDDHTCKYCNAKYAAKDMLWKHIKGGLISEGIYILFSHLTHTPQNLQNYNINLSILL